MPPLADRITLLSFIPESDVPFEAGESKMIFLKNSELYLGIHKYQGKIAEPFVLTAGKYVVQVPADSEVFLEEGEFTKIRLSEDSIVKACGQEFSCSGRISFRYYNKPDSLSFTTVKEHPLTTEKVSINCPPETDIAIINNKIQRICVKEHTAFSSGSEQINLKPGNAVVFADDGSVERIIEQLK